jgi:hypothetical protein
MRKKGPSEMQVQLLQGIEDKLEGVLDGTHDDQAVRLVYEVKKDLERLKNSLS